MTSTTAPARPAMARPRTEAMNKGGKPLRPAPPARHRGVQPRQPRRNRDQSLQHRPHRRCRPQLPLPEPRPAQQDPRTLGRPARHRRLGRRPRCHPRLTASRPARRPRTRAPAERPRPTTRNRLSEVLGEQTWSDSGLGAPADIDALTQKINQLQQQAASLSLQPEEPDQDLAAARAANREPMTQLNNATHCFGERRFWGPGGTRPAGPPARGPLLEHLTRRYAGAHGAHADSH